jgi:hypothetical protein
VVANLFGHSPRSAVLPSKRLVCLSAYKHIQWMKRCSIPRLSAEGCNFVAQIRTFSRIPTSTCPAAH